MRFRRVAPLDRDDEFPRLLDHKTLHPVLVRGLWLSALGLPFLCGGAYILAIGTGLVDRTEAKSDGPNSVIVAFGFAFAVAGLGLIVEGALDALRRARLRARERKYRGDPWLADHDWNGGVITASRRDSPVRLVMAAAIWVAVTLTAYKWLQRDGVDSMQTLGLGVILLAMAALLVYSLVLAAGRLKYGRPWIEVDSPPTCPGETLSGRLHCRIGLSRFRRFELALRCVEERRLSYEVGNKRTVTTACYQLALLEVVVSGTEVEAGALPFSFEVPPTAMGSRLNARLALYWELEVTGVRDGVDFKKRFLVPIYGRGLSDRASVTSPPTELPRSW